MTIAAATVVEALNVLESTIKTSPPAVLNVGATRNLCPETEQEVPFLVVALPG